MIQPILSICIPTYNREPFLKELLDSIIRQEGFSSEVEIMVYNDPSKDNTATMMSTYINHHKNIRYHRNEERIGMIPSILEAVDMCQGTYVWLFSDDDLVAPGALKTVLHEIKTQQSGLILNKFISFENGKEISEPSKPSGKISRFLGIEKFLDFLSTVPYSIDGYLMHCSLFCFKKKLFIEHLQTLVQEKGTPYFDTLKKDYFAHVKIIYLPFGHTEQISVIEKNLVLLRAGNISWTFIFKTCTDYLDLIEKLHNRYSFSKKTYRRMKQLYYYSVFTYIIIVHIQKHIPKKIYTTLVDLGKRIIKLLKIG